MPPTPIPDVGDLWLVNFGPPVPGEAAGVHPALIVAPQSPLQDTIDLARRLKQDAEKRAQERYDAIAAMPPLKRIDTYICMREV